MPIMKPEEIQNVIPGESMTAPKGVLPFDKPAKTADPEVGIQLVFDAVTEPKSARKLVKTLNQGVPVETIVESMMLMLHGEGIVSPQAIPLMGPAMVSLIEGMGKIAGADVARREVEDPWTKPDEDEVEKLVAKITGDLSKSSEPQEEEIPVVAPAEEPVGLMAPPISEGIE